MKFSRGMMILSLLTILTISACSIISSPLKKAEKLTESADMKAAENNQEGAIADYKKAIDLYEQIIAEDPESNDALKAQLAVGKIYHDKLDQKEKGRKQYQRVVDSASQTELAAEAMWRIAVSHFNDKNFEEAASVFNRIVNRFPTLERGKDAQIMLAKAYEEDENYEKAAEVYDQFANRYPDDKYAAVALQKKARIYREEIKSEEEAIKADQRLIRKFGKNKQASKMVEDAKSRLQEAGAAIPEPEEEMKTQMDRALERRRERREKDRPDVGMSPAMRGKQQKSRASKYFGVDANEIMQSYQITVDDQGTMYDAMFMIADMLYASEQYKQAGALYERAIEMTISDNKRPNPRNYKKLADCYRKLGFTEIAMDVLKRGVRKDPGIIDSIIISGETQHANNEYDKAIETYESVIGLTRAKDPDLYYHIGLVHRAKADKLKERAKEVPKTEKAERFKERAKKERLKELEMVEKAVAMRPSDKELLQELAVTLYHGLRLRDEAYVFDRLAKDEGTNRYDVQKGLADLCYKYENYNWARTKYRTAIRVCERQKKKAESEKSRLSLLINVQKTIKDRDKAQDELIKAEIEELRKVNKKVADKFEQYYIAERKVDEAISVLNDYYRRENPERRIKELEKEIKECDQHILLMSVRLAVTEAQKGNLDKAQQSLDELAVERGDHAYIHYGQGEIALIKGETETGIAELKKALELDASLDYAANAMKRYYLKQGNSDEAIKILETFVEKNPYNKMMELELQRLKYSAEEIGK